MLGCCFVSLHFLCYILCSRSVRIHLFSPAYRPHYSNDTYVSNNLAMVHIYFKTLHFMRQERAELFGIVDFFSNIGGLLGLCMGVSALSVVELAYFFTLRLGLNVCLPRREDFPGVVTRWQTMLQDWGQRRERAGVVHYGYGVGRNSWGPS